MRKADCESSRRIVRQPSPPLSVRVLVRRISGTAVLARHPMCRTIQNQGDAKMIRKLTLCSAAAFFAMSGVAMAHDGSHPNDAQIAHIAYRSEEHTSELQSLMRISYAVFCLQKKK